MKGEAEVLRLQIYQEEGEILPWIVDFFDFHQDLVVSSENHTISEDLSSARALCLDVVPRNLEALYLYHKLGFVDLSLVTLRKEFGKSHRNTPVALLGKTFHM